MQNTKGVSAKTDTSRTLLFAPFVPYIVVFCHVMETLDRTDLERLEAFVRSIQEATAVSESAAKMYGLFQVLCDIATSYVTSSAQHKETDSFAGTMDAQLVTLGFPHSAFWGRDNTGLIHSPDLVGSGRTGLPFRDHNYGPGTAGAVPDGVTLDQILWQGNSMQLENWLYDNQASIESLLSTDPNGM